VAIILTIPDAMASLTGTPEETNMGMRILAPPRPVRDPRNPMGADIRRRDIMFNIQRIPLRSASIIH